MDREISGMLEMVSLMAKYHEGLRSSTVGGAFYAVLETELLR